MKTYAKSYFIEYKGETEKHSFVRQLQEPLESP